MTVTSIKTEYRIEFDQPVVLTSAHHYDDDPHRNYTEASFEVTGAVVTTDTQFWDTTPYVRLMGFTLTKTGARSKRQKKAEWVGTQTVITRHIDGTATFDSSAYDLLVAQATAEAEKKGH